MKKHLTLLLFTFTFICLRSYAQSYSNWWYFGSNAGVTFQTGNPVAVAGGQLNTSEGCATISDIGGNLLFYTDGIRVWNRNHVQMPNGVGLMGDPSSTQSGVIVQRPGSTNIFYVFTVDNNAGANGCRWSEVDMNLQGGFGDVTANKNILLYTPSAEKICGVRHCNNTDVWVVTHEWNSNGFRSYLVTAAGINPVPVISNSGSVHSGSTAHSIGYMKNSPDGTKLALVVWDGSLASASFAELFDFNNSTGVVSNGLFLANFALFYGIEFSPNSTLLYANHGSPIDQWNLCAGSNAAIVASRVQIGTSNFTIPTGGSLQLGSDNKIYHTRYGTAWLGVINNPNVPGVGCNYVDNGVPLTNSATLGLPNFIQSYLRPPPVIQSSAVCLIDSFSFTTQNSASCTSVGNTITSVSWNFGDPLSGPNNISNLMAPVHVFSASGNYTVTLIVNYTCYSDTTSIQVNVISCGVTVTLAGDSICEGACTNLTAIGSGGPTPYTFTWTPNIGSGPGPHPVCPTTTTVYSVLITDSLGDTASTSATVFVYPLPVPAMTATDVLCFGDTTGTATVNAAGNSPFTYAWSTTPTQTAQTATGLSVGTYTVTVTDVNGCSQSASITVNEPPPLVIDTSTISPVCTACNGSATANPSGGTAPYSYSWNTIPVQNTQTATGLCQGTYTVTITDANGCTQTASATLVATSVSLTVTISSVNNALCNGDCNGDATAFTSSGSPVYTYLWNTVPPQLTATASSLCAGMYSVIVADANGCTGTTVAVVNEPQPLVTTASNNVAACVGQSISLGATSTGGTPGYNYTWNPGNISGASINVNPASTAIYIVSTTDVNGCPAADDSVLVTVNPPPVALFTPDKTSGCSPVCVSFTNQTLNPASSFWDFGDFSSSTSTNPSHCYNTPGTYDVTLYVTDNNGCTDSLTQFNLINVHQWAAAAFTMTPQPPYLSGTAITFNDISTGASIWTWNFGDPLNSGSQQQNPVFAYDEPGTYIVTLLANNVNGCFDTVSHTVRVDVPFDFFVPDAFTPNGDNLNEIFLPMGIGYHETEGYELTIYDRWGAVLFRSRRPGIGWDGRSADGSDVVPAGVYVWTITVRSLFNNIQHSYIGHVTVVK